MLRHTFLHMPGVGPLTELRLWESGITTWEEFLGAGALPARVDRRRSQLCEHLMESRDHLESGDAAYFDSRLPPRERWRVYSDFRHRVAYLDIETTGLAPQSGYITMVGIIDSLGYSAYVHDENLDDLRAALEQYDLVVTFNGAAFDLPYIEYHFGRVFRNMAHLDLMYPLRRLGYKGGLKSIEPRLGVNRPSDLENLDGFDAVLLWHMWRRGDRGARETLIRYNAEDVASLPELADIAYRRLASRLPVGCAEIDPFPRPVIDLPYDLDAVVRVENLRSRYG